MSNTTDALLEERGKIYGDIPTNFANIASCWSGIIGVEINAHQVALMMVGLKLVRANTSPDHKDNLEDAAGYVRIGQVIQESWENPPVQVEYDKFCPSCHRPEKEHVLGAGCH